MQPHIPTLTHGLEPLTLQIQLPLNFGSCLKAFTQTLPSTWWSSCRPCQAPFCTPFRPHFRGLPWWLRRLRIHLQCRRSGGSIPGLGRSPGEENGYSLQYSCLENSMGKGASPAAVHGSRRARHNWATNNSSNNNSHVNRRRRKILQQNKRMNLNKRKDTETFILRADSIREITIRRHSFEMEMLVGTLNEEI